MIEALIEYRADGLILCPADGTVPADLAPLAARSLATVLNVMSDCNLNLTKIQSLPVIETPWKYSFFVDITFERYENFAKAKSLLQIMTEDFQVLGEYKNARI